MLSNYKNMNKDALFATIVGVVIGVLITGIIILGPHVIGYFKNFNFKMPNFAINNITPNIKPDQKDNKETTKIDENDINIERGIIKN